MIIKNATITSLFYEKEKQFLTGKGAKLLDELKNTTSATERKALQDKAIEEYKGFLDEFSEQCEKDTGEKDVLHDYKRKMLDDYEVYLKDLS